MRSLCALSRHTRAKFAPSSSVASRARSRLNVAAMASSSLYEDARSQLQLVGSAPCTSPTLIHPVASSGLDSLLQTLNHPAAAAWVKLSKFKGKSGEVLLLPDALGGLSAALLGVDSVDEDTWAYAALPGKLPPGTYALADSSAGPAANKALLGWMLGCYKFSRYKTGKLDKPNGSSQTAEGERDKSSAGEEDEKPLLVIPEAADRSAVFALAHAFYWCRDMINTPAEDLGPQHLAAEATALAAAHAGASIHITEGDDLLVAGYPAVHTVGRAAARPPLLIELNWAPSSSSRSGSSSSSSADSKAVTELPLVALVGKGVCFDSGGLDIKTAAGMKQMKKDMGGGALMLALAHVIMSAQLPVRLRVLVPAVENAISGNAYRPGDVLQTRAGLTVENGNTDAEGRLILCDAIYEAAAGSVGGPPDVLIDAATLTGAARVALGPELPAVFSSCDDTWSQLEAASKLEADPLWRLPLWPGYRRMLDSKVADLSSTGEPGQAGSITAALFLLEFAKAAPAWLHIDTAGWVSGGSTGPGRPEGGEALGLRALWRFLQHKYGATQ